MLVILLSLTLCLMAFLPFFQTRAASEFSTPLTEMSFIEQLYQSNYIQYKYLKEKTDQKNWSYSIGRGVGRDGVQQRAVQVDADQHTFSPFAKLATSLATMTSPA